MAKVDSRHIEKVKKNVSELNEMKKLKQKHFRKKDREYLFDKLDTFEKRIERVLKTDLENLKNNVAKLENSKKEIKEVSNVVDELVIDMNQKLRTLEHKKKLIKEQKLRLSKKKGFLKEKEKRVSQALNKRKKKITLIKNLKKKV